MQHPAQCQVWPPCLGIQQYCWQFHLVLDHTVYATVCWSIQEPFRCVDFLSFSANEEQFFKDKGTLVGYLLLLSHLLPPSSNYALQASSCLGRVRTSFISARHRGLEGKRALGIFTLEPHIYQRALFSLFPWSHPWERRQNTETSEITTSLPHSYFPSSLFFYLGKAISPLCLQG